MGGSKGFETIVSARPKCRKDFSTKWLKSKLVMFSRFMGLSIDKSIKEIWPY